MTVHLAIWDDVRFSLRLAGRRWMETTAVVTILAIGLAVVIALFSGLHSVILRPLHYPHAEQLVQIWATGGNGPEYSNRYLPTEAAAAVIEGICGSGTRVGFAVNGHALMTLHGEAESVGIARISPALLDVLDIQPILGRVFSPRDWESGGRSVALISEGLWRKYGAANSILGGTLSLDSRDYEVVGVMPASLTFPNRAAEIWVPESIGPTTADRQSLIILRMPRRGSLRLLRQQVALAASRLKSDLPHFALRAAPMQAPDRLTQAFKSTKQTLSLLLLAAMFVFALTLANVAALWLAGGDRRMTILATMEFLGASPGRIARVCLVQAATVTSAGLLCGVACGGLILGIARSLAPPEIPALQLTRVGWPAISLAAILTVIVTVALGYLTFRRAWRARSAGNGTVGHTWSLLANRGWLLSVEVAMAIALLTMTVQTLRGLADAPPNIGFEPGSVIIQPLFILPVRAVPRPAAAAIRRNLAAQVVVALRGSPGIIAASIAEASPIDDANGLAVRLPGDPRPVDDTAPVVEAVPVGSGYFATLRIPLAGRDFTAGDFATPNLPPGPSAVTRSAAVIVNETFVATFGLGKSAVGREIRTGGAFPRMLIVGIADVAPSPSANRTTRPRLYLPWDGSRQECVILVRTQLTPDAIGAETRNTLTRITESMMAGTPRTLTSDINRLLAPDTFRAFILSSFAGLALVLALTAIFAFAAISLALRRREFSVRAACGARPVNICWLMLASTGRFLLLGLLCGFAITEAAQRLFAGAMSSIGLIPPIEVAGIAFLFSVAALAAISWPIARAARSNPAHWLRVE